MSQKQMSIDKFHLQSFIVFRKKGKKTHLVAKKSFLICWLPLCIWSNFVLMLRLTYLRMTVCSICNLEDESVFFKWFLNNVVTCYRVVKQFVHQIYDLSVGRTDRSHLVCQLYAKATSNIINIQICDCKIDIVVELVILWSLKFHKVTREHNKAASYICMF